MRGRIYIGILIVSVLCIVLGMMLYFRNYEETEELQIGNKEFNIEDIVAKQMENIEVDKFCAVADEFGRTLILGSDGYVYEWVGNEGGQLLKVEELENIKQIEMGLAYMYALDNNGDLYRRSIKIDRNIKSEGFKKCYDNLDIDKIDFNNRLTFIKNNKVQYVLDEIDRMEISNTYTFSGIVDICNIEEIDYVLDKDGVLWRINNRKRNGIEPEKLSENICKVMSRENKLIAIDKEGNQILWRQDEDGELFIKEKEKAYDEYMKALVMDEDYLFTSGGHLYDLRFGIDEVVFKDKVIYYNKNVILTEMGDVYYTKEGHDYTYIVNIYNLEDGSNEEIKPKNREIVCTQNSMQGLIANNSDYLLFIAEDHTLYECREKKIRRRTDVREVSSVAISNDRNYIIDRNGNVYVEKRNRNIALGFESLNIENVKAIKACASSDVVVLMQEDQLIILDNGQVVLQYDIKYSEIADICIFQKSVILLEKTGKLLVSDIQEQGKAGMKFREIASNIKYIETNNWYLLGIDTDDTGYFWHDDMFELYEKSEGFENIRITSKNYCVDCYGQVWNLDSDNKNVVFDDENVIYLSNDFFMTEAGNIYKISISDYEKEQVDFLFNIGEYKEFSDKKTGNTEYDLSNIISMNHTCKYRIQKYSEISGYVYYGYYSDGLISVMKEINGETQWGFIDIDGNEVIPCMYDAVTNFNNGIARVKKQGISYEIDKTGNIVNEYKEGEMIIGQYSEGLVSVEIDNKVGFIDEKGNTVIAPQFEPAIFGELSYVFEQGLCRVKKDGKIGMIDATGEMVIPNVYSYLDDFVEGLARFSVDGQAWGYMDRNGNYVFEPIFDYVYTFSHGLTFVNIIRSSNAKDSANDNWYIMNTEGQFGDRFFDNLILLAPVSDDIYGFSNYEGEVGFMDNYGDILYKESGQGEVCYFLYSDDNVIGIWKEDKLCVYKVLKTN